jgi:hypothetical protein
MVKLTGGCLCGEIRYEITEDTSQFFSYSCYCRACQYITGGQPNSVVYITKKILITKGKPCCYNSKSEFGTNISRFFCNMCGTHLYGESENYKGSTVIKVGTLDDPSFFNPKMNVWVSNAQPWHYIDSNLKNFDKAPA